jgi:hypothetical protein
MDKRRIYPSLRQLQNNNQDLIELNARFFESLQNARIEKKFIEIIPDDPQQFYTDLGYLKIPNSGKLSPRLTDYQIQIWNDLMLYKWLLIIKGNKIGVSTICLDYIFHLALTDCKGYQILIMAQDFESAAEHLDNLAVRILKSDKYRKYLRTKSPIKERKNKVTNSSKLIIENFDDPYSPTEIIAVGSSTGKSVSWKNVKCVYISDITRSQTKYDHSFIGAMSRLANTDGYLLVETIPSEQPEGIIYEIYENSMLQILKDQKRESGNTEHLSPEVILDTSKTAEYIDLFRVREMPTQMAVPFGLVEQEWLDKQRRILGEARYLLYYGAKFIAGGSNLFSSEDIDYCVREANFDPFNVYPYPLYEKSIGIDLGFGSSSSSYVVTQIRDGKAEVLRAALHPTFLYEDFLNEVVQVMNELYIPKAYVDGSNAAFVKSLKATYGEFTQGYEMYSKPTDMVLSRITPVNFGTMGVFMVGQVDMIVKNKDIRIPITFTSLINQMRTVQQENGRINKKTNSYDLIDALMLSLLKYDYKREDIVDNYGH